jgi:hypothetical protein
MEVGIICPADFDVSETLESVEEICDRQNFEENLAAVRLAITKMKPPSVFSCS